MHVAYEIVLKHVVSYHPRVKISRNKIHPKKEIMDGKVVIFGVKFSLYAIIFFLCTHWSFQNPLVLFACKNIVNE